MARVYAARGCTQGGGTSGFRRPAAFRGRSAARGPEGRHGQLSQILKALTVYGDRGTQVPPPGYVSNSPVSPHSADW